MLRQEMGRGSSVRSKIRRLAIIERNPAGKVLCHKKIRISGQNPNISQPYVSWGFDLSNRATEGEEKTRTHFCHGRVPKKQEGCFLNSIGISVY